MFFFNFKQDELQDYYLAYFDILGYKSYFENESDPYDFLSVIQSAIEDMKKSVNITLSLNDVDVKFRAYSDNFLFYIKHENNELGAMAALAFLTQQIQRRRLEKYSILIRGGITIGKFYVNKDFIFGKGLIDVYTLENKFAVYPRIILDNKNKKFSASVLEALERQGYISKDEDDFYYVQFFDSFGKDNDDTILRANIKKLVNTTCRYRNLTDPSKILEREKLITKYLWLVTRFNKYCETHKNSNAKIEFHTTINLKVLKTEVVCK